MFVLVRGSTELPLTESPNKSIVERIYFSYRWKKVQRWAIQPWYSGSLDHQDLSCLEFPLTPPWEVNASSQVSATQRRGWNAISKSTFSRSPHNKLHLCLLGQNQIMRTLQVQGKVELFNWIQDTLNAIRALVVRKRERMDIE